MTENLAKKATRDWLTQEPTVGCAQRKPRESYRSHPLPERIWLPNSHEGQRWTNSSQSSLHTLTFWSQVRRLLEPDRCLEALPSQATPCTRDKCVSGVYWWHLGHAFFCLFSTSLSLRLLSSTKPHPSPSFRALRPALCWL